MTFPRCIAHIIADYAATWTLRPWVSPEILKEPTIAANPNAHDATGCQPAPGPSPTAAQRLLLRAKTKKLLWYTLRKKAESLQAYVDANESPALAITMAHITGNTTCGAPGHEHVSRWARSWDGIELHARDIDWGFICEHTRHIILLQMNIGHVDWGRLSANPHAIDLLREHPKRRHNPAFATNPAIFEPTVMPGLVDALVASAQT